MVIVLIKSLPSCIIILGSKLLEENFHWIYFFISLYVNSGEYYFFEARFINLKNKKWSEKIILIIEYS